MTLLEWIAWRVLETTGVVQQLWQRVYWAAKCVARWYYGNSAIDRTTSNAAMVVQLLASKQLVEVLESNVDLHKQVEAIVLIKRFQGDLTDLTEAVRSYHGLQTACQASHEKSTVKTTWDNSHEHLLQSHSSVFSDRAKLNWVNLGFQGSNPATDFRATGQFGLDCFTSLCVKYPTRIRTVLRESGSWDGDLAKPWYSLALVSIHFSQYMLGLDRILLYRQLLALSSPLGPEQALYELHHRLVFDYHQFWTHQVADGIVRSVLDSESCLDRFKARL